MTNTAILEADYAPITGIWDADETSLFARYRVTAKATGKIIGGVPQKPEIIESWLRQRIIGGDEEVRQVMLRTLDELGHDVSEGMTNEELVALSKEIARQQHGNTFKRDSTGLFLSDYQFKAMLKENVAILYPWQEKANRLGPTQKAARAFWAERVFVDEPRIYLTRDGEPITQPDGMHLQIGHITGPKGARSTLTYYDYVDQPEFTFTCSSLEDVIDEKMWKNVLLAAQRNGIGAIRSMSFGQFRVTGFEKV